MGSIQCQCNKNNEKEFVIEKKIEEGNPSAIASSSSQFPNVQSTGECNNNKEELNKNEEKDKEEDLNDKEHAHLDSNNPDSSWEYESNSNTKHNNRYNIFNIPQRQTKNQVGMSTNPPLEIINEMAGPSKDSFANEEGEMKNERDIVIVDEDETEQPNAKPSTIRSRNLQPSDDGRISSNVLQNMEDNHISFQKGNKKSVIEPIRKSQLIIKNKINWKSLLINHIIPEGKLIKTQDDDILFQSDLLKYLKDHKQARGGKILSPKFCLLTRTEFK